MFLTPLDELNLEFTLSNIYFSSPVSQHANSRFEFGCQQDNQQQPQGTSAAGPGDRQTNVKFGIGSRRRS